MGDRTFSAEDVIRIYSEFLTPSEQETVDLFFAEAPVEEMDLGFLENLLDLLELLLDIFVSARFTAVVLTFGTFTSNLVNDGIRLLRNTNEILGNIVDVGGVDA